MYCLKKNQNAPRPSEHPPAVGKKLLFLTFSVLVANPKKLLYTVANPARGLLNREKRTKEKVIVWQHTAVVRMGKIEVRKSNAL